MNGRFSFSLLEKSKSFNYFTDFFNQRNNPFITIKFLRKLNKCLCKNIKKKHIYLHMPKFILTKDIPKKKDKHLEPVAIVKGENNEYYNKLLCLDNRENHKSQGQIAITIPDDNCFQILPNCDKDKRDVLLYCWCFGFR